MAISCSREYSLKVRRHLEQSLTQILGTLITHQEVADQSQGDWHKAI